MHVGYKVGETVGCGVGFEYDCGDCNSVGFEVSRRLGWVVGSVVGFWVGFEVGRRLG